MVAPEQDHPGAGPEDRRLEMPQRLVEAVELRELEDRRRLPARNDEAVDPLELLRLPHLDDLRAEPPQHRRVLAEVPLHGEDADPDLIPHAEKCRRG